MEREHIDSSELISGDFPRITKLVWFEPGTKYQPGTVVCPKPLDDDHYVMLEAPLIDRVASIIYDNPITKNAPIINQIAERVEQAADRIIMKFRDPLGILAEPVNAVDVKRQAAIWITGCFNPDCIVYGKGIDHEVVAQMMADRSIFLLKRSW